MSRKEQPAAPTLSNSEQLVNPLLVLTNAYTGCRIAVSGMWIETIEETAEGTAITLRTSNVTVKESFTAVTDAFTLQAYRESATPRRRRR